MTTTTAPSTPLQVSLRLGDTVEEVRRNSVFPVPPASDVDPLVITDPCVLHYRDPDCSFTLPPTRFLTTMILKDRVCSCRVTPHMDYLTLDQVRDAHGQLQKILVDARWRPSPGSVIPLGELQFRFGNNPAADGGNVTIMRSAFGGTLMELILKRRHKAGGSTDSLFGKQDLFLLDFVLDHPQLRARYS